MIENIYRQKKASVDVNGSLTDVFERQVVGRKGDSLSSSVFINFMNHFQKYFFSKFTGINLNYDDMNVPVIMKLHVFCMLMTPYFLVKLQKFCKTQLL